MTLANLLTNSSDAGETNALLRILVTHFDNSTILPISSSSGGPSRSALVRQNCILFASLCSSLLSAAGAVIAKQWLVTYERTGQTGSLEDQSLRRTEKFHGAEVWQLQICVEALPALLLVSLGLFFAALVDYLLPVDHLIAITVLSFAASGTFALAATVIVAAIDPNCPFQTSLSVVTRAVALAIGRLIWGAVVWLGLKEHYDGFIPATWWEAPRKISTSIREIFKPIKARYSKMVEGTRRSKWLAELHTLGDNFRGDRTINSTVPTTRAPKRNQNTVATSQSALSTYTSGPKLEILYARAIIWMLSTASEERSLRIVAENIPKLTQRSSVQMIARSYHFPRLLLRAKEALLACRRHRDKDTDATAAVYATAVSYIFSSDQIDTRRSPLLDLWFGCFLIVAMELPEASKKACHSLYEVQLLPVRVF